MNIPSQVLPTSTTIHGAMAMWQATRVCQTRDDQRGGLEAQLHEVMRSGRSPVRSQGHFGHFMMRILTFQMFWDALGISTGSLYFFLKQPIIEIPKIETQLWNLPHEEAEAEVAWSQRSQLRPLTAELSWRWSAVIPSKAIGWGRFNEIWSAQTVQFMKSESIKGSCWHRVDMLRAGTILACRQSPACGPEPSTCSAAYCTSATVLMFCKKANRVWPRLPNCISIGPTCIHSYQWFNDILWCVTTIHCTTLHCTHIAVP